MVLLGLLLLIAFGAMVRNQALGHSRFGSLGKIAFDVASIPATIKQMGRESDPMTTMWGGEQRFPGRAGWTTYDDAPLSDMLTGYILLSRFDGDVRRHMVELIALPSLETSHIWRFEPEDIFAGVPTRTDLPTPPKMTNERFRAIHPLALDNGDLIIKNHHTAAVRINSCGKKLWHTSDIFHHSSEFGPNGLIWIPSTLATKPLDGLPSPFQEDGVTAISVDGETVFNRSLVDIFMKNDLGLMITSMQVEADIDPLHLNDVQPVMSSGPFWQKGDVFLSMRHKSALALYRPSTDKILWFKIGPWTYQHDIDILDDHTIAVYSNNTQNLALGPKVQDHNEIMIYDFETNTISTPYSDILSASDVRTISEGLSEELPGGFVMVEEENYGRILILNVNGKLIAEYINGAIDGKTYRLGWSRPIDQTLGDKIVAAVEGESCE